MCYFATNSTSSLFSLWTGKTETLNCSAAGDYATEVLRRTFRSCSAVKSHHYEDVCVRLTCTFEDKATTSNWSNCKVIGRNHDSGNSCVDVCVCVSVWRGEGGMASCQLNCSQNTHTHKHIDDIMTEGCSQVCVAGMSIQAKPKQTFQG